MIWLFSDGDDGEHWASPALLVLVVVSVWFCCSFFWLWTINIRVLVGCLIIAIVDDDYCYFAFWVLGFKIHGKSSVKDCPLTEKKRSHPKQPKPTEKIVSESWLWVSREYMVHISNSIKMRSIETTQAVATLKCHQRRRTPKCTYHFLCI